MVEALAAFIITIAIIALAAYAFIRYRSGSLPWQTKSDAKAKTDITSIKTVGVEGEGKVVYR